MKMRPGGEEIDNVETAGPGTLDFLPNRAGRPKRSLKGDRMWIAYGPENHIQSFRSVNVSTRTEKPAAAGKPAPPPSLTQSKELMATFDPKTSEMTRLEQKTDFRYEEGVRRATATRAVLEQPKDLMTLDGAARVWDPTGSVTADHMVVQQKSGDFTAEGSRRVDAAARTRRTNPRRRCWRGMRFCRRARTA
jgi:lipopolysaccharide export system protein LptA